MMLPRTGADLPPWRRQVMPWLMAAVRLMVAWYVLRTPLQALLREPSFIADAVGRPLAWGVGTLLAVGGVLFAWPRTVLIGYPMLVVGIVVFEWIWRRMGAPNTTLLVSALGIFTVLAVGEWLVQKVQKRLYAPPDR